MAVKVVLLLLLVTAFAEEEISEKQRQVRENVRGILATADKDAQGQVTAKEYGRLLLAVMNSLGLYKRAIDMEKLVAEYVDTLSGPLDPSRIPDDIITGAFSQKVANAELNIRRFKRDL